MAVIAWIVLGFLMGLIARALFPGRLHLGLKMTMLLAIGGSVIGGLLGTAIRGRPYGEFHGTGFVGSILGGVVLLVLARSVMTSRTAG